MLFAEFPKKRGNSSFLVGRTWKVVREAATGEARSDLGKFTGRTADARDEGACSGSQQGAPFGRTDKPSDVQDAGNRGWNWTCPELLQCP